jgi:hypothetical protein
MHVSHGDESGKHPHTAGSPTTSSAKAPPLSASGEAAYFEGEIAPFYGDYRSAIASIQSFAERLRREKAVAEVNVVQLPLDVDPSTSLSGSTLNGNAPSSSARFKLKIVLRAST